MSATTRLYAGQQPKQERTSNIKQRLQCDYDDQFRVGSYVVHSPKTTTTNPYSYGSTTSSNNNARFLSNNTDNFTLVNSHKVSNIPSYQFKPKINNKETTTAGINEQPPCISPRSITVRQSEQSWTTSPVNRAYCNDTKPNRNGSPSSATQSTGRSSSSESTPSIIPYPNGHRSVQPPNVSPRRAFGFQNNGSKQVDPMTSSISGGQQNSAQQLTTMGDRLSSPLIHQRIAALEGCISQSVRSTAITTGADGWSSQNSMATPNASTRNRFNYYQHVKGHSSQAANIGVAGNSGGSHLSNTSNSTNSTHESATKQTPRLPRALNKAPHNVSANIDGIVGGQQNQHLDHQSPFVPDDYRSRSGSNDNRRYLTFNKDEATSHVKSLKEELGSHKNLDEQKKVQQPPQRPTPVTSSLIATRNDCYNNDSNEIIESEKQSTDLTRAKLLSLNPTEISQGSNDISKTLIEAHEDQVDDDGDYNVFKVTSRQQPICEAFIMTGQSMLKLSCTESENNNNTSCRRYVKYNRGSSIDVPKFQIGQYRDSDIRLKSLSLNKLSNSEAIVDGNIITGKQGSSNTIKDNHVSVDHIVDRQESQLQANKSLRVSPGFSSARARSAHCSTGKLGPAVAANPTGAPVSGELVLCAQTKLSAESIGGLSSPEPNGRSSDCEVSASALNYYHQTAALAIALDHDDSMRKTLDPNVQTVEEQQRQRHKQQSLPDAEERPQPLVRRCLEQQQQQQQQKHHEQQQRGLQLQQQQGLKADSNPRAIYSKRQNDHYSKLAPDTSSNNNNSALTDDELQSAESPRLEEPPIGSEIEPNGKLITARTNWTKSPSSTAQTTIRNHLNEQHDLTKMTNCAVVNDSSSSSSSSSSALTSHYHEDSSISEPKQDAARSLLTQDLPIQDPTNSSNNNNIINSSSGCSNGNTYDRESAKRLAKRLYNLSGFKRSDVCHHLGKNNPFSHMVAQEYVNLFDFRSMKLDAALRKFLSKLQLNGETQERERMLSQFSQRYYDCNKDKFPRGDIVQTLVCALILLNTDLHGGVHRKKRSKLGLGAFIDGLNSSVAASLNDAQLDEHLLGNTTSGQNSTNVSTSTTLNSPNGTRTNPTTLYTFPRHLLIDLYESVKKRPLKSSDDKCDMTSLEAELDKIYSQQRGGSNRSNTLPTRRFAPGSNAPSSTLNASAKRHLKLGLSRLNNGDTTAATGAANQGANDSDSDNVIQFKSGYLNRKRIFESRGKPTSKGRRGWRRVHVNLQDLRMIMQLGINDESSPVAKSSKSQSIAQRLRNTIKIHHTFAKRSTSYTKREFVFHLRMADQSELLLQANNEPDMISWIDTINFATACLSSPALESAVVNSRRNRQRTQRPILPATYTKLSYWEQLINHEERLQRLKIELDEHLSEASITRNANKRFKTDFIDKIAFMKEEIERYSVYVDLMRKKSNSPEAIVLSKHPHIASLTPSEEMIKSLPSFAPYRPPINTTGSDETVLSSSTN